MRSTARLRALTTALLLAGLSGCVSPAWLGSADVLAGLSYLVLQPEDTCSELRDRYHLDYLPIVDNPAQAGIPYEEIYLPVDEKTALRTWYMPTVLDRGTVVYSCGNSGSMACYLFSAQLLTRNGWSVAMYDYEGFGLSGGEASLATLYRDLATVVDWARTRSGRDQVTLMGLSLGSIPTIAMAAEQPEKVNGVILDSPIAFEAQIRRFRFFVGGQVQPIIDHLESELLPDALIRTMYQPVLVYLHGLDDIATPATVEALYDDAAGPKALVRFDDQGHARGQFFDTDVYLYYLESFLTDVWSGDAQSVAVLGGEVEEAPPADGGSPAP